MLWSWSSPTVSPKERRRFLEDVLAPGNLRRLFWFILLYLPISGCVLIVTMGDDSITSWSYIDLGLAFVFLGLVIYARRKGAEISWKRHLVLAYYVYLLVVMDGYYFASLDRYGENSSYILGLMMAAVILHVPPSQFIPLLLANHITYIWLNITFFKTNEAVINSLVAGLDALILALLAAWFLFHREWEIFQKGVVIEQRNRELALANEQLRHRNEEMNQIMAIAAHDLRSPLTSIKGIHDFVRDDPAWKKEPYASTLADIGEASSTMLSLIGRLLDAHSAEHKAGRTAIRSTGISYLIERCLERIAHRAEAKNILIESRMDASLEVETDPEVVEQALDNLFSNAIKFSPKNTTLRITVEREAGSCRIDISDEGPGIPEDEIPRLFRKFQRGRNQPTDGEPTTGLGLYIVRHSIESVGGSVQYEPRPEGGSTFRITLPLPAEARA